MSEELKAACEKSGSVEERVAELEKQLKEEREAATKSGDEQMNALAAERDTMEKKAAAAAEEKAEAEKKAAEMEKKVAEKEEALKAAEEKVVTIREGGGREEGGCHY